jgi:Zeta toxin
VYERADGVPCDRQGIIAGGLPGADKASPLAKSGADRSHYLTISIDRILEEMAAYGLIPPVEGLSPMEAAELVHAEAQFVAKRLGLRALAGGRNLILDISMASLPAVESWLAALRLAGYSVTGIFADVSIEESVRRCEAEHRRRHDDYCRGVGYGGRYVRPEAIRALAITQADLAEQHAAGMTTGGLDAAASAGVRPAREAFPGGPVTEMITSFTAGQLTLDALALEFRARRWPPVPSACPPGMQAAASAIDDPEPYVPGSFDDVVLAYDLGQLTDHDYEQLASASL